MKTRVFEIIIWWLLLHVTRATATTSTPGTLDAYHVLQVRHDASHEDIRRSYRKLALQLHPDKNVQRSPKERKHCEERFKEVQKAYSLVGTAESRRNYDLASRYGRFPSQGGPAYSSTNGGFNSYNNHWNRDARYTFGRHSGGTSSSLGSILEELLRQNDGFVNGDLFNLSKFKSTYVQKVPVSLEDLYSGKTNFEFNLKGSIWQQLTGAFRGGLGYVLLYQSMLLVLPILRFSKIVSLVTGACLFVSYLPASPTQSSFSADVKAGYKGGTRLTFSEDSFDVVFILSEIKHARFVRKGNDLYTTVYITPRQAKRGTNKQIKHLDGSLVDLEIPSSTQSGRLIRLKEKGWPGRRNRRAGDLIVQVRIKSRRTRRRQQAQ